MNKSIISILLIAIVASAHAEVATEQLQGWDNIIGCINGASKLITEVTEYIKNKNWWDGPAVGRIVSALSDTWTQCSQLKDKSALAEPIELAAVTETCKNALRSVIASIDSMKSSMSIRKWSEFEGKFGAFKGKVSYARSVC